MGLRVVAVDGNASAPGLAMADAGIVADITSVSELTGVAREQSAAGIWPGAELGVIAAAGACAELGLVGVGPEVAQPMRNKLMLRRALDAAGVPNVPYGEASTLEAAEDVGRRLGLPVVVKPADGNASKGVQVVDDMADMALAFGKARSVSGVALIEGYLEGEEYHVDGLVYDGAFILGGITGKERSSLPYRYDIGIWMPPMIGSEQEGLLAATVEAALRAVGCDVGTVHAEVILSADGPRLVEMAWRPGGARIPTDLIPATYGMDYTADSLRIALGEAPIESRKFEKGTAVYWIPSRSGVVTEVTGVDEARAMDGVMDVVINVQSGDTLGHIIDCVSRDRIGHVYAAADTPEEAMAIAKRARDAIEVHTNPTL